MKINAPINSYSDLKALIPFQIDSVYVGMDFLHFFTNNRSNRQNCGIKTYDELKQLIDLAHKNGVKVKITLNNYYTSKELEKIQTIIPSLEEIKIDSLIVADLALIEILKSFNISLTASVLTSISNSYSSQYFKSLGIKNMVLAYHLSVEEICNICNNNTDIKFEILGLNYGCFYEDGLCNLMHSIENTSIKYKYLSKIIKHFKINLLNLIHKLPNLFKYFVLNDILKIPPCTLKKGEFKVTDSLNNKTIQELNFFNNKIVNCMASDIFFEKCAICCFYDFINAGVSEIKIAGRDLPISKKIANIKFIKEAIEHAHSSIDRLDYINKAKMIFFKHKKFPCNEKFCYYLFT